jgi:hypothetical protein
LVDTKAKVAAKGHTSDTKQLPHYLRKPLLINLSAVKKAHSDELKREWKEDWRNSEQGKVALRINESTPSGKFLKSISIPKLPKAAASKIMQLRLTHILLNSYLKRIWKINTTRCPVCGADEESIEHFLLCCLGYAHKRWPLTQHARKRYEALTLKMLLGNPQLTLPLAAYIQATGRFVKPGECNSIQGGNTVQ